MKISKQGTILVYTLVLVLLGVFMAMALLNLAQKLEADYKVRQLDIFFSDTIKAKSNLMLKYGKSLNSSGGGFVDDIGCPQDITFSGSLVRTENISTELRIQNNLKYCEGMFDGSNFQVYFNADVTDTFFIEYQGAQVVFNSSNQTATLAVSDPIFVDGTASFPLLPDSIDDTLDSDNYRISSTGSILYPDGYIDNDADHRLSQFGYIMPGSDWYNIYWLNDKVRAYIESNPNNIGPLMSVGDVSSGRVHLDISSDYDLRILRFDRQAYGDFNELRIILTFEASATSSASIGYVQEDFTLAEEIVYDSDGVSILSRNPTGDEYEFDFSNHDYAIFVKNMSSNTTILYQMYIEQDDGTRVYFVPIQDSEPAVISMLGNHITFSESGLPVGEHLEIVQLK